MEDISNNHEVMWLDQAKFEARKHISLRYQKGGGACNLFILDVSESMQGEGIQRLKRGVIDILDEYSNHPELDENVAVIVFGEETKFLHYYSNDYAAIRHSIENLECSGPSPLTAAFLLALGGLFDGSAHTKVVGDFHLDARVVVFTDGRLTDFTNENATELNNDGSCFQKHKILPALYSIAYRIGERHPIYCVPVGSDPDYDLLTTISSNSLDGRVLDIHKAKWFGKRTLHYLGANVVCRATNQSRIDREVLRTVVEHFMSWKTYDEDDLDSIDELLNNKTRIIEMQKEKKDPYGKHFTEKYATGPKLGTRVRRGPHWTQNNQDSEGPGTIVGHGHSEGLVYVQWDTGVRSLYGYGYKGIYDVVQCEEARYPMDGLAAVGCFVRRGPDWKWEDQDGGAGSIGTVYRAMDDATVYVRWPCGRKGNYRFGYDGKFDIDVCDPFSPSVIKSVKEQERNPTHLHSDKNSSNNMKGKLNMDETLKDMRHGKESISINPTLPKQVTNDHTDLAAGKSRTHLTEIKDRSRCNTQSSGYIEDDIETDAGFHDNVPPNSVADMRSGQSHVCSEMKCGIINSTSGNSYTYDCHKICPEGLTSDTRDEYKNNLLEKKNSFLGNNKNLSQFKESLATFWQNERLNPKNENLQKMKDEETSKEFRKNDSLEINSIDINCCWQWLDSRGLWIDYPEHINSLINRRLQQYPNASVVVTYNGQRVVAHKLLQINTESKERHAIRWKKTTKNQKN